MQRELELLTARVSALPFALRCLRERGEAGRVDAWERADELLADLEVLLGRALSAPRTTLAWLDVAEEAIERKGQVYALMYGHLQRIGESERTVSGYERAARMDVRHSEKRLSRARVRRPVDRRAWRYA